MSDFDFTKFTLDGLGSAHSATAGTAYMPPGAIITRPWPPDPALHPKATVTHVPVKDPTWTLPGIRPELSMPIEGLIAAASVGAIVAWYLARRQLESFLGDAA